MSDELFDGIMKTFLAQLDSSLKISKIISEHSGEEELSEDAIISGLVYRLMTPMTQNEINECMKEAEEILKGPSDEEEEEEDQEYDTIRETYIKSEIPRQIKSNNCNCEICLRMRTCLLNYKTFETKDQLSQRFKNSIEHTCNEYNIYI